MNDAKKLEKAVGEEAAKIIVETFEKYDEKQKQELATKGDLHETFKDLDNKIDKVEARLESKINTLELKMEKMELRLKHDLTIRLGAMLAASVGLIALILRFMLKP